MKNAKEDIVKFDFLESNEGDMSLSSELRGIKKVDQLFGEMSDVELGDAFTSSVMLSAVATKRRKSRFVFFAWTIGAFITAISLVLVLSLLFPVGDTSEYLLSSLDQFEYSFEFFADARFKLIFVICEAIMLLIVAEKVLSRYGVAKQSVR